VLIRSLSTATVIAVLTVVSCASAQVQAPAAPTNLQIIVANDALAITILWEDNADDEESYIVERSTSGAGGPWEVVATLAPDTTNYGEGNLSDGVTYWYRVAAENAAGRSAYSNVVSGTATALPGTALAESPTLPLSPSATVAPSLPDTGSDGGSGTRPFTWIATGIGMLALAAAGGIVVWRRSV